jgi:hypothetical protein
MKIRTEMIYVPRSTQRLKNVLPTLSVGVGHGLKLLPFELKLCLQS